MEENSLSQLQRSISIQSVPCSHTSTNQCRYLRGTQSRTIWNLYHRICRQDCIFSQEFVYGTSMPMIPVFLRPLQISPVITCDDTVSDFQVVDPGANFHYLTGSIGARDDIIFDRERICAVGDSQVSVVQSEATDFNQDLMSVNCRNRLRM